MKVLFVTLFALETNTSVTKSNYGLLKGLLDLGCEIDLVMPEIDARLSYYDNFYDTDNINIIRIKNHSVSQQIVSASKTMTGWKTYVYNILKKAYFKTQIFDRTKALVRNAKNIDVYCGRYDIVISTSDPKTSHLFTAELIKNGLSYGKWIQHWGDPLSGDITKNNVYPEFIIKRIERKIISKADTIVYVSPFTYRDQKKNHPFSAKKMQFVPLPCDPAKSIKNEVQINPDNIRMAYLGDYNSSIRNILPLYETVKRLKFAKLFIAGNSDLSLKNTDNISVFPRLPQAKVQEMEDMADVIVSVGNLKGTQIPGKIYYAASSNKIILATIDGDSIDKMYRYLDSFGRFICCRNTVQDITKAISNLRAEEKMEIVVPDELYPKEIVKKIFANAGIEV